jgi:hypothetical protein
VAGFASPEIGESLGISADAVRTPPLAIDRAPPIGARR